VPPNTVARVSFLHSQSIDADDLMKSVVSKLEKADGPWDGVGCGRLLLQHRGENYPTGSEMLKNVQANYD